MRRTLTFPSATILTAMAAQAASDIAGIDWNGDRFASFGERMIAFSEIDGEDFGSIDSNCDNRIDATELYETSAQNLLARHEDRGREVRVVADRDGDGLADHDELPRCTPVFRRPRSTMSARTTTIGSTPSNSMCLRRRRPSRTA